MQMAQCPVQFRNFDIILKLLKYFYKGSQGKSLVRNLGMNLTFCSLKRNSYNETQKVPLKMKSGPNNIIN